MNLKRPRAIGDLLLSGDIASLGAEARERRELAASVRAELPESERAHVVSAHIDDEGRLVVAVDSPAWAARLRHSHDRLLDREVRVRVAVPAGNG